MKNMYERYGNQMILLDATYKTTKYALPLFFVVVLTNVNFQVCCVIVLQEESTEMITKALKIFKEWNPLVSPKYLKELRYSCATFTGSKLGIYGQVKLKKVSAIFPIRSNLDYVALLILQRTQIAKLLRKT